MDATGYPSSLVDAWEIEQHLGRQETEGVDAMQARPFLKTITQVGNDLIREGYLARGSAINPVSDAVVDPTSHADLAAFRATYVSIRGIASTKKLFRGTVVRALAGALPAILRSGVGSTFYRRDALSDL